MQGEARRILAEKLALVRPEHRESVVYFDAAGNVYANRPHLAAAFTTYRAAGDGRHVARSGASLRLPADPRPFGRAPPIACTSTTGAYHRVHSNPGAGPHPYDATRYAYTGSLLHLPPEGRITVADPQRETVYVYTGGWAQRGTGLAVDAGFQFDPDAEDRNWALFVAVAGTAQVSEGFAFRYASGQYVDLEFYVPADGTVVVHAAGTFADPELAGDLSGGRTLVADAPGWRSDGLDNVLKRVTSIAQAPQDLDSGSSISGLQWLGPRIGMPAPLPNRHPWAHGDTHPSGGVCHFPDDDAVRSDPLGRFGEEVRIELSP